ncbi:MAG TPA: APC family permease, partial [Candidatus Paceibacterota bacterium]|nr:APC family permease [Candidatus Paceibacterota bacterium]
GGVLAFLISVIYAEVASSVPEAGASVAYSFSAYGRGPVPFILTWLSILGNIAYGSINAIGFALYLSVFVAVPLLPVAIGLVLLFMLVNLKGVKEIGSIGKWSALVLLTLLGIFLVIITSKTSFTFHQTAALFQGFFPGFFSIFGGTALIFSAFIGFEGVSSLAQEIKDPNKNIPRALFTVIGITTLLYVIIGFLVVYALPLSLLSSSEAPLSLLAINQGSSIANLLISLTALLASGGALLMDILISSRKVYAAAEQGFLPKIFQKVSLSGTPIFSVIAVATAIILLILTDSVSFIAYLGNSSYLLFAAMLALALMIMRKKRPYLERPFRTPFFPAIPLATIACAFLVIFFTGLSALFWLLVWSLLGFVIYLTSLLERKRLIWVFYGFFSAFVVICFLIFSALGS